MQPYLFADLDDTLFQTRRKLPDCEAGNARPTAYLRNGEAISYATLKQQRLWRMLAQGFRVIPVTARNYDAYSRVDLPFVDEAVLNHGGVILNADRAPDAAWLERTSAAVRTYEDALRRLLDALYSYRAETGDAALKPRLIEDFGVCWYLVVKHAGGDETALERLANDLLLNDSHVLSGKFYLHGNGNNLAVLPRSVNKADAVAYLRQRFTERHDCALLTVGMGDSLTDAPFMALCDYALIPNNTQLHRHIFDTGVQRHEERGNIPRSLLLPRAAWKR
ncbi:MAG: hydrolase [Gammaproteobacteria bacterium]